MTLRAFLAKRLIYTVVLIVFIVVLNFIIFQAMPGLQGNFYNVLFSRSRLPPGEYEKLVAQYGLNQSIYVRFQDYVTNLLTFNFGYSYTDGQPVSQEIVQSGRLFNTLLLLGSSGIISIIIGILLGIVVSTRRGSSVDNFWVTSSLVTFSLPTFFLGIILIFIFAIGLGWFPSAGSPNLIGLSWLQILYDIPNMAYVLFLPALTLTLFTYGGFLLLTRATMIEVLNEDYIVTARAKGLSRRVILLRHAFKNASLPLITASALNFAFILSGAVITETVFTYNGLGYWLFNAITSKDWPVLEAMFYIIALMVVAANLISDILYGMVDPRIKYE
ncbi:MAG TPA: ABC transporter permease [Candidatus Angelobacter sp.]|nr:ABC transporter permease [Candidatus Angelobacter sp.]